MNLVLRFYKQIVAQEIETTLTALSFDNIGRGFLFSMMTQAF